MGVAGAALASPPPWSNSRHNRGHYDGYDYAPVTRVEPIVRQVRVETPRRECWDDVRYVESRPHISDPRVGGRTLLGGIIGGVIGHQIGSGRGRDAATIAGTLIGAGVGYDSAARRAVQQRPGGSRPALRRTLRAGVRRAHRGLSRNVRVQRPRIHDPVALRPGREDPGARGGVARDMTVER